MASRGSAFWWLTAVVWALLALPGCPGLDTSGGGLPSLNTPSSDDGTDTGATGGDDGTTGADTSDPCVQTGAPASSVHRQMRDALNAFRQAQGLQTLQYSKILEAAADAHARDMYQRDFFDHVNPDGNGPDDRAVAAGFCRMRMIGENIAWNYPDVAAVQTGWEDSPGHRANMVNDGFRYVGMGYYYSPNGPYYVQLFGDVFPEN